MEMHNNHSMIEQMSRDIRGNCELFFALFCIGTGLLTASVGFSFSSWTYSKVMSLLLSVAGLCTCILTLMVAIIILQRMEGLNHLIEDFRL